MLKHIIVLLALSLAVIFGTPHIHPLILALVSAHDWISRLLLQVFSNGQVGSISRQLIALLAMPLLIALVPTLIFWLAKRRFFPYFFQTVWVLWLLQTTALIMMYKIVVV
jgi:hypothetical protein